MALCIEVVRPALEAMGGKIVAARFRRVSALTRS